MCNIIHEALIFYGWEVHDCNESEFAGKCMYVHRRRKDGLVYEAYVYYWYAKEIVEELGVNALDNFHTKVEVPLLDTQEDWEKYEGAIEGDK